MTPVTLQEVAPTGAAPELAGPGELVLTTKTSKFSKQASWRTVRADGLVDHIAGFSPVDLAEGRVGLWVKAHTRTSGGRVVVPPGRLCTDNGAMIAWAGAERLAAGLVDGLDAQARARWPLDGRAEPKLGSGQAGAKA